MAKEVIFVADDFGINDEVNDAILHAHLSGELTGASLMMDQPGTDGAVAMAKANPSLQVGLHVHLCDSEATIVERWPWGNSPLVAGLAIGVSHRNRDLMRLEVEQQWRLFKRTGLECRFVNSHHHIHAHPVVYAAILRTLGPQFAGWIRLGKIQTFDGAPPSPLWSLLDTLYLNRRRRNATWRATDTLWGLDRTGRMNAGEVRRAEAALPDGFHEFLFHPRTRTSPDSLCLLQSKASLARD